MLNLLGMWNASFALALSSVDYPGPMPNPNLKIITNESSLSRIDYYVSSTGATSGIRYRTKQYYITLRDENGSPIATFQFKPDLNPPPPGQTKITMYIITAQDLINAGFPPSSLIIDNFSRISLSATIEIYNANTGQVLSSFGDKYSTPTTIYPVIDREAGRLGFGSRDIQDMKSRYSSLDRYYDPPKIPPPNVDECITGQWSWYEYSGNYYERTWMTVSEPEPSKIKAGQGTYVEVTTYYMNNDPAAWDDNLNRYTTGIEKVTINGPLTDDWEDYKKYNTWITEEMIPTTPNPVIDHYEDFYAQTYAHTEYWSWTDEKGIIHEDSETYYFYYGYNVPVVKQTWLIPYARFDSSGWTRHQTPPTDIDNRYVFGGLNRWYFGFDIPDDEEFELRFSSHGGVNCNLGNEVTQTIMIQGSPYDDIIVRVVDPENPFPGGISSEWRNFEECIKDLSDWYNETKTRYQAKLEEWRSQGIFKRIYNFFTSLWWGR